MGTVEDMYSLQMYGATQKFRLDVWSMLNFTYPRKLTYKLLTHMMKV